MPCVSEACVIRYFSPLLLNWLPLQFLELDSFKSLIWAEIDKMNDLLLLQGYLRTSDVQATAVGVVGWNSFLDLAIAKNYAKNWHIVILIQTFLWERE